MRVITEDLLDEHQGQPDLPDEPKDGAEHAMLIAKHMPKGPKGQKRPADVIGNAVRVMKIATGEIAETLTEDGKNAAAVALGRKGGLARAKSISKAERVKIARKGAREMWKGRRKVNKALDRMA